MAGGITIDLSGRFLYSANFADNNTSGFKIDASTGALTSVPGSPFPVGFRPISVTTVGAADVTPPVVQISVTPDRLWPPDGRMVPVTVAGTIIDSGSGIQPGSAECTVIDEYHHLQPQGKVSLDAAGNYSFTVLLRASREPYDLDGRRYSIRVNAKDNAGNRAAKTKTVIVPYEL